jgi:hypothetical protein
MTTASDPDKCVRCGGHMEEGTLVDRWHWESQLSAPLPSHWAPGQPAREYGDLRAAKHEWRQPVPVRALRCVSCGRLDLFAFDRSVRFA